MRLAFNGEARFADFGPGYELYLKRERKGQPVDEKTYRRVLKAFCKRLADRLEEHGMVDLPCGLGTIAASTITRKAMDRNGKFDGYGKYDRETGLRDGKLKTFGIVYLAGRGKGCLRSYGFVANRRLFQRVKEKSEEYGCPWTLMDFNDSMV